METVRRCSKNLKRSYCRRIRGTSAPRVCRVVITGSRLTKCEMSSPNSFDGQSQCTAACRPVVRVWRIFILGFTEFDFSNPQVSICPSAFYHIRLVVFLSFIPSSPVFFCDQHFPLIYSSPLQCNHRNLHPNLNMRSPIDYQ